MPKLRNVAVVVGHVPFMLNIDCEHKARPTACAEAMKPTEVLFAIAAMALALSLSGCASVAAYQANHPYYRFPSGGGGGGGGNGG